MEYKESPNPANDEIGVSPSMAPLTTYLFTDLEGSTRLWEQQPERMRPALAWHDRLVRAAVSDHDGRVVKSTGDGIHAAFGDPLNAVRAALTLQLHLADAERTVGIPLKVRCGLHAGADQARDGDYFGPAVNRAARIMGAAHGGQILLSEAVAAAIATRLPDHLDLRDLGRIRLRDLAAPERIYQAIHPRLPAEFPPLRSLEATPNNLARQINSFIGRTRERQAIRALLDRHRLVTLYGVGGIGKTRLSIQTAAEMLDDYPDGVWFIDLAPITDPRLVAQVVAFVLAVREEPGRPVVEALEKFVRNRRLLLILDNCEHLLDEAAHLAARMLRAGPEVRLIASSRECLRIDGEAAYQVPALDMAPTDKATVAELMASDAVRLFAERAATARNDFAVTDANIAAIDEICRRLDGIPLAIELAAAQIRALPLTTISAQLQNRFRLLALGDRTHQPRQRTLEDLIGWSYGLLAPAEAMLFRRLAIFANGWTIPAAEAIAAAEPLTGSRIIELLARLVEKSLVLQEAETGRYRLLETVRHFARGALDASPEAAELRRRHVDYFLALIETARPYLAGPEQAEWLARLDADRQNLSAAFARSAAFDDGVQLGARFVHAMRPYWYNRGLMMLGLLAMTNVLARPGIEQHGEQRYKTLFGAGQFCYFMGRWLDAQNYLVESLEIARQAGDATWIAGVLQITGMAYCGTHQYERANACLEEALELAKRQGNPRELAAAYNTLAQLHRLSGQLDRARPLYLAALEIAREIGDRESEAILFINLAILAICMRQFAAARHHLGEALNTAEAIGSRPLLMSTLEACAALAAEAGDCRRAAVFFGAAEMQGETTGLHRDPADEGFLGPIWQRVRNELTGADWQTATERGRTMDPARAQSCAHAWLLAGPAAGSETEI